MLPMSAVYVYLFAALFGVCHSSPPPSIVYIVADDLGYNDISFHGSPQIPTPNIDAIFSRGTSLSQYHGQPVCSPTRATILSGRHAIHHGIYMPFDSGVTNERLDPAYTLLPRYLQRAANYQTHAVGKWHLGANTMNTTPQGRGFLTHLGYWSGAEDYTEHTVSSQGKVVYDMQDGITPRSDFNGTFSTEIFAAEAVRIIEAQGAAGAGAPPLFLYLAFQNVHWPLEAPARLVERFANATGGNHGRAMVCAMAAFLDEAVGNVTAALARAGLAESTLVAFVSDNGGPTHSNEGTWSNNFPLRGGKNTLWSGGTRLLGAVAGPGVPAGVTLPAYVHATDWLPTLVSMATGGQDFRKWAPPDEPPYEDGDGIDLWQTIASGGQGPAQRDWLLLETHANATYLTHGDALIVNGMKLLSLGPTAPSDENGWWPPDGQDSASTPYTVHCAGPGGAPTAGAAPAPKACVFPKACLFNLTEDPCEYKDVSAEHPQLVAQLQARLAGYRSVPPIKGQGCMPNIIDIPATGGGVAHAFQPCDAPTGAKASAGAGAGAAARPNVLLLLSESLDGRLLREDSAAKIPNIRALLASGSVRFDAGYSNNPVCAPSRASLWSGRAPHKIVHEHNTFKVNGAWNNAEGLPVGYSSRLDQLLNASGYTTGVFGKTDWTVGGHTESCLLASLTFNVPWPYNTSSPTGGWNQEGATCTTATIAPGGSGSAAGSQYPSDWRIMDSAAQFVATQPQPVFAFAGPSILHPAYHTDEHWYSLAAERPNPALPPLTALHPCDLQASMKRGCIKADFANATRIALVRRVYMAELEEFDAMVGAAVATLKAAGRLESTWIILAADHGDMQQEHQMFYKMVPYDASSRVPFIWAHPSLGTARVIQQPAQLLDIFPTVLAAAGLPVPPYADGYDLAPFLKGASSDPTRPPIVVSQNHDEDISMSWFLASNGTHKLVQYGTGREVPPQLFNTAADPDELVNLAPAHPEAVAQLDAALRSVIDYPAVAMDVALYQKQQLRYWVNETGKGWEAQIAKQRWQGAWDEAPDRALAAVKAYLADDSVALLPCNGALAN